MNLDTRSLGQLAARLLPVVSAVLLAGVLAGGPGALTGQAATCTDSWTNASGGDWFTGGKWSNGVPTSSDDACITLDGTYTVTMSSSTSPHSVTIGATSGTQTLSLAATSSANSSLQAAASVTIGAQGVLDLTATSGTNYSLLQAPTITNGGALSVDPGTGGLRYLRGSVVNNGSATFSTNTAYDQTTTFTNNGTTTLAGAGLVLTGGATFTNASGGALKRNGSGQLSLFGCTYNASGSSFGGTGSSPILIDGGSLNVNKTATFAADLRGTLSETGNVSSAQTLALNATSGENMTLTPSANLTNAGSLTLSSLSGTNYAVIAMNGKTLTNTGTLSALAGTGGSRLFQGNLINEKALTVDPGVTLQLYTTSGNYSQTSKGTFTTRIDAAGNRGQLTATGSLTLAGTLAISRAKAYAPTSGTFPLLSGASLTGAFTKETGAVIKSPRYFLATDSATTASITVTTASTSLTATSGPPGTSVTVNGSGYPPGDTVTITFKDSAGTTTTLATAATTGTGTFSQGVTIPAGAAVGKGKLAAKSAFAGVTVSKEFNVT
jgi:hypothetical protein